MAAATAPYTGYTNNGPASGQISNDYVGSYQDWLANAAAEMARRYAAGDQSMLDGLSGATGPVGQPDRSDFGSAKSDPTGHGHASSQTQRFFENYLQAYAKSDPWVANQFGAPPARQATYQQDPNSTSSVTGQQGANTIDEWTLRGKNDIDLANINNTAAAARAAAADKAAMDRARGGWESDWKIASLNDAGRRYVAEGDWGTQRAIADSNNKGSMDRLILQLGFNREELAQRAVEERDKNDVALKTLALDVAKYDAELGGQPGNIWKYAAWLNKRGQVVNGLNIAMASSIVPADQIPASTVATSGLPGAGVAAAALPPGQQPINVTPGTGPVGVANNGSAAQNPINVTPAAGAPGAQITPIAPGASATQTQPFDYAAYANKLLGDGGAPGPTQQQMQDITTERARSLGGGQGGALGSGTGPLGGSVNALGVDVGDPSGAKVDYRKFVNAPWAQQQMKVADANSVGMFSQDFLGQLEKSRPKGNAVGAAAWG